MIFKLLDATGLAPVSRGVRVRSLRGKNKGRIGTVMGIVKEKDIIGGLVAVVDMGDGGTSRLGPHSMIVVD